VSGVPDAERRIFVSAVPAGCAERRGGLSLPSPVMSSSPCYLNKQSSQKTHFKNLYLFVIFILLSSLQ